MTAQQRIAAAVEARGYFEGYSDAQLLARQVCKMIEEVAELAKVVDLPLALDLAIYSVGESARSAFDDPARWCYEPDVDVPVAKKELADVMVTVACAGDRIERMVGKYDVVDAAVEKAISDVKRGIR